MEVSINGLTERTEEFLSKLASARHRQLAGTGARQRLATQVEDFISSFLLYLVGAGWFKGART